MASHLNTIADDLENSTALSTKIKTSMMYPLVTLIIALICCSILLIFVIPTYQDMYAGFGGHLPVLTQFVINVSQLISQNLNYILGIFLLIVVLMVIFKQRIISVVSQTLVLNWLIQKRAIQQFTRYFSTMVAFDVPVKKALFYSGIAVDNPYFSKKLVHMSDCLTDEKDLKTVLAETRLFSNIILQVASVGEKSKTLHMVFKHIANFQEKEINRSLFRYTTMFDALFIVLIGTLVGGLVIAMYLPIFSMAGSIGG
jgi:type IV pilus assembly protein PilC